MTLRVGDVFTYKPDPHRHDPTWCREGWAVVRQIGDRPVLVDTYWSFGQDSHHLTDDEQRTIEHQFFLGDYVEHDPRSMKAWEHYRPEDRAVVPSQHGLQRRRYVRIGSEPDQSVRIDAYRDKVIEAEKELEAARRRLEWARRDLAEVEGGRDW